MFSISRGAPAQKTPRWFAAGVSVPFSSSHGMSTILALLAVPTMVHSSIRPDSHAAFKRHNNSVSFWMCMRIAGDIGAPRMGRVENSAAGRVLHVPKWQRSVQDPTRRLLA